MRGKSKKRGSFLATFSLSRNRRGSHVGVILSFVIFITFIVFLYSIIKPAVTLGEEKKTTLDYIEYKIEENTSSEFTSISMKIHESENPTIPCVKFENFFLYSMVSAQIVAKNETGNIQNAYYNPASDFDDLRLNRGNKDNLFFKVYYSPEFDKSNNATGIECELVCYIGGYNITSINSDEYVFEKNIYELIDYYNNNYEKLKSEFSVPAGTEFEFSFIQSNGTRIGIENASKSVNVYAEEIPIQYIDNKANIHSGFINVKVW